jgi:hypothetical protein
MFITCTQRATGAILAHVATNVITAYPIAQIRKIMYATDDAGEFAVIEFDNGEQVLARYPHNQVIPMIREAVTKGTDIAL